MCAIYSQAFQFHDTLMVGHSTELASHEAGEAAVVVVVVELVCYLNRMAKSVYIFFFFCNFQ